jgi:methionyl aminopeptidase
MIAIRTEREIALLREANRIVAEVLCALADRVEPGITTKELDTVAEKMIRAAGGEPSFLGYQGYPASTCISVDEEIIHGIPGSRRLKEGEICSLDVGVRYKGYYGDAAFSVPVGEVDEERQRLLETTDRALVSAIAAARAGNTVDDIGRAVEEVVRPEGFSIVRNFVGHGIGTEMHAEPQVPNFATGRRGAKLKAGMILAIEPMINAGTEEVIMLDDGWTAITADRRPSAHFEHSIVVREGDAEILSVSAAANRRWGMREALK